MLKDLEKRQNSGNEIPLFSTSHFKNTESERAMIQKLLIPSLVIFIIISLSYFVFNHKKYNSLSQTRSLDITNKTEPVQNNDEKWVTPVSIEAMTIERKDNTSELSLMFTHNALYRVISNANNNQIIIMLDNANLKADLPSLNGSEPGVLNVTTSTNNNILTLTIMLKAGGYLKSINYIDQTKNPELVISIGHKEIDLNEAIKGTKNIKTPAMQTLVIERFHNAINKAESGNTEEAIEKLSTLLKYYPDYNDARVSLAALYIENGNDLKARKIIDDGLAINPDYLPLIELKARLLTSQGKIKEALMVLQSEQPQISDAPKYYAFLAALYSRENNYQLASNIYRHLVQIDPHEGSWWFGLAVALDNIGNRSDAIYAYTKAATEGRLNSQAHAFLQSRLQVLQKDSHVKE
jgi:Flp pilus assembly protein TadD